MRQCGARYATDDNVIWHMLDNEGYKHTEYVICSGFHGNSLYKNAHQCYI